MKSLHQIVQNIKNWNAARSNLAEMNILLNQGNGFTLSLNVNNHPENTYVHAYPAVSSNGQMLFYYIASQHDTQQQFNSQEGITPFIFETPVVNFTVPNLPEDTPIPPSEALNRIQNWTQYHNTWIPYQMNQPSGIYQAFVIPSDDIIPNIPYKSYFALAEQSGMPIVMTADLILWDEISTPNSKTFEDMVRPVPPFGIGQGTDQNDFFLLNYALQYEFADNNV